MTRLLAFAAVCALAAAPMTFAQTAPPTTAAPPSATEPVTPPATPAPATPTTPTTPATPATPTTPTPGTPGTDSGTGAMPAAPSATEATAACRTRKQVGEQCSCLSAPTTFGTAAVASSGDHNMCMVPQN